MAGETFVVIESSRLGDTVVGVFSSLAAAWAILPSGDLKRLESYRVEMHIMDEPAQEEEAWVVTLARDGGEAAVERVILCSCGDDHTVLEESSYIEAGGGRMHVIVWALTQGSALAAAERYRDWLLANGIWGKERVRLDAISAALALTT